MRRLLAGTILISLILSAGAVYLLTTTSGARWLSRRLPRFIPGLSVSVAEGSLWRGLHLDPFQLTNDHIQLTLATVDARWSIALYPRPTLHLQRVHVDGFDLHVAPAPPRAATERPEPRPLRIPIQVFFGDIQLSNARVTTEAIELDLGSAKATGTLKDSQLDIQTLQLREIHVLKTRPPPPVPDPRPAWYEALDPANRQPVILPDITLPLPIRVRHATLEHATWQASDATQRIEQIHTVASMQTNLLQIDTFDLRHEQFDFAARGSIQFSGEWPLDLSARFRSRHLMAPHGLSVDLALRNSLNQLEFDLVLHQPAVLTGRGVIHPLQPHLPAQVDISWSRLAWPLHDEPTIESRDGSFHVDGSLNTYQIKADLGVRSPVLPEGRWVLDAQGDLRQVDVRALAGELSGQTLQASGHFAWAHPMAWDVAVSHGPNAFELSGSLDDELLATGRIDLPDLGSLLPDLAGNITGDWAIQGPPNQPDIRIDLQGRQLAFRDHAQLESVDVEARINALGHAESRVHITADSLDFPSHDIAIDAATLALTGDRRQHRLTLDGNGEQAAIALVLRGGLDDTPFAWSGLFEQANIAARGQAWKLDPPTALHYAPDARQVTIAAHRWLHADDVLLIPDPLILGAEGRAHLQLDGFELAEFHSLLPDDLQLRGTLAAEIDVNWTPGEVPQGKASLELHQAGLRLTVADGLFIDDAPPLDVAFETVALTTTMTGDRLEARFQLEAPGLGAARAQTEIRITPERSFDTWSGHVALEDLKLDILQPFLDDLLTLSGDIHADVHLSGSPRRPLAHGQIRLTNGIVEPAAFPVTLGDIHLTGMLHGDRAEWDGGFRSGQGQATLQGDMALLENEWAATLHLVGDRLDLAYGTLATLQASPDLRLDLEPGSVVLAGTVRVPRAHIAIQHLPESAVRPSRDVVMVEALSGFDPAPASPPATEWSRSIDLDLRLGDEIQLRGMGITGRLEGTLRVQQTGHSVPRAFGELRIVDGRYRAYGQRLQIRRGQLVFAGPVDQPTLMIEAVREIPAHDTTAGLRVEGRPDDLKSSLFSEPTMAEEDILAFLLLGRPLERGEESETNVMLARAAIALGIAGGGSTITSLGESLGIEDIQLDTAGEGDDTQVVVSGQVSPRLQLSYGVGVFNADHTLTARYRLARRLFLEAVSGLESSLDLLYTFRF